MIVKKKDFIRIMDMVKPGLSKKDVVKQLQDFFFTGKAIATYNEEASVSHPLTTDFKLSVNSAWLHKQVSLFPLEEMEIKQEGNELQIRGGDSEIDVTIIEDKFSNRVNSVYADHSGNIPAWKELPKDFIKGVELCMFSIGKDASTDQLTSFIRVHGNKVHITDGTSRMSEYSMESGVDDIMFIKGYIAPELIKYAVTKYKKTNAWQHFKTDNDIVFSIGCAEGSYPDINEMINELLEGPNIELPKELKDLIISAEQATEDIQSISDREIICNIVPNKMTISWKSAGGYGRVKHSIPIVYEGKDYEFHINPTLMKEILDKTTTMHVDTDKFKAIFSFENFKHGMMLVQLWD